MQFPKQLKFENTYLISYIKQYLGINMAVDLILFVGKQQFKICCNTLKRFYLIGQ